MEVAWGCWRLERRASDKVGGKESEVNDNWEQGLKLGKRCVGWQQWHGNKIDRIGGRKHRV